MFYDLPLVFECFVFVILFILLFLATRRSIQALYTVFQTIMKSDFVAAGLISLIFFPGTVIHELSHFFMAVLLFLPVHKLSLLPKRQGQSLRLGYVLYEKKDVMRGIMVGIAPIIVGVLILWWFYNIQFFSIDIWQIQVIKAYLIFVLTSTMFSSRQDLIDIGYAVPFLFVLLGTAYIFNIDMLFFLNNATIVEGIRNFMYSVSIYTSISLAIHIVIILICTSFIRLLHIRTR